MKIKGNKYAQFGMGCEESYCLNEKGVDAGDLSTLVGSNLGFTIYG